jgi:hypothetical protein
VVRLELADEVKLEEGAGLVRHIPIQQHLAAAISGRDKAPI